MGSSKNAFSIMKNDTNISNITLYTKYVFVNLEKMNMVCLLKMKCTASIRPLLDLKNS